MYIISPPRVRSELAASVPELLPVRSCKACRKEEAAPVSVSKLAVLSRDPIRSKSRRVLYQELPQPTQLVRRHFVVGPN